MQPSYRRLQSVLRGVDGGRRHSPHNEPAAAVAAPSLADPAMDSRPAKLLSDRDVQEFIRSGWMSLGPEEIGLPPAQVEQIHRDGCRWFDNARDEIADPATGVVHPLSSDNLLSEMPGLQDVCRSPAVHGALRSLLGEGYVLHPHGGFHAKPPGSVGQSFHKDGFFPGGGHGIRYHRPEYLLFFYYPQDTTELRGPTEILPQSQFLSNDSHMSPSHPQRTSVSRALFGQGSSGIAGQGAEEAKGTEGAQCYEEAVAELGWPNRTERLVVPAGTVVLTHFDVFHRGTHGPVEGEPYRLMLKLWYCRQQDNTGGPTWDHRPAEEDNSGDGDGKGLPLTFLETRPPAADVEGQASIWNSVWQWMLHGQGGPQPPLAEADAAAVSQLQLRVTATSNDGSSSDAALEPSRISAAYQLAELGDTGAAVLLEIFDGAANGHVAEFGLHGWGPLRSAAYALSSSHAAAVVPALAELARESPLREVRALALFSLGQSVSTDVECLQPAVWALHHDESSFVRSTAAAAVGFAGRRLAAAAADAATEQQQQQRRAAVANAMSALTAVCCTRGGGDTADTDIDFFGAGDGPEVVRSAVRENASISLCMLATAAAVEASASSAGGEGAAAAGLEECARALGRAVHEEKNKFVHAFLHESLRRLSTTAAVAPTTTAAAAAAAAAAAEAWAAFEASERWRPPHYQVAHEFVSSLPSECLFESVSGTMGADQNGSALEFGS